MSGLDRIVLRSSDGASAEVYLHGAHVTSWRPIPGEVERLFLSERSEFREGAAIRGGIPVIFPQFASEGPLPKHGFARTSTWTLREDRHDADGSAVAVFTLASSASTHSVWPHSFLATVTVRVHGPKLSVELEVENTGAKALSFTAALHTYLRVHDISETTLTGLQGRRYRESSAPTVLELDEAESLHFDGEVDRVYVDAPRQLSVHEPTRELVIEAAGFRDVVVWNPGVLRAAELKDMEPGGEQRMLCVEAAAVQEPVHLHPNDRWTGSQALNAIARYSTQATRIT